MLLVLFVARRGQSRAGRLESLIQYMCDERKEHIPIRTAVLLTSFILLSIPVNVFPTA